MIYHRGRHVLCPPLIAPPVPHSFAVTLSYEGGTDWYRNVLAASPWTSRDQHA